MDFSGTTSSEVVVFFFTKFSNGKILREILVLGLDSDRFKVSVAANRIKLSGVFTEFSLTKLVNKHNWSTSSAQRHT